MQQAMASMQQQGVGQQQVPQEDPQAQHLADMDKILASANLAENMDDEQLDTIGKDLVDGFEDDLISRQDWIERSEQWLNLAMQVKQEKTFPWKGAANVKYPLLTTAAIQFHARAYPALVNGTSLVKGQVIGYDPDGVKGEAADRIGKHMSYQLLQEMTEWDEDMDKLCLILPILGCVFKKTYYDPLEKRNKSDLVLPKDFVIDYWATSLEKAVRKTHILYLNENDIRERVVSKVYSDVKLQAPSVKHMPESSDDINGKQNVRETDNPYEILEIHGFLDLDDDGYKEPYIITVDRDSRKVLRIVSRFESKGVLRNDDGDVYKIIPTEYFTKYDFIPNPDGGFYSVGFGLLLGALNETANTLINQLLDAGTLAVTRGGFLGKGLRMKGGTMEFRPNEWKFVNSIGDDLKKNIVPLPTPEPSDVLFKLLGTITESGEKLASVAEIFVGKMPGQNTPATTTMATIEQGLKVFTAIYKRVHRSLSKEFKKLFMLNSMYLDPQVEFTILGNQDPKGQQGKVQQTDYRDGTSVVPASDPNIVTDAQKLVKAQGLLELMQLGSLNPQEVTKRILTAQDQPNIEALMNVPQSGPPPEILLKQAELEQRKVEFEKTSQLKEAEIMAQYLTAKANAILAIAKAQSMEHGDGMSMAQAMVDQMQAGEDQLMSHIKQVHDMDIAQKQHEAQVQQQQAQGGIGGGSNQGDVSGMAQ